MASSHISSDRLARIVSAVVDNTQLEKPATDPLAASIIRRMRFRLMGYDHNGQELHPDKELAWEADAKSVLQIEKKLVIDPEELKEEFRRLREADPDQKAKIKSESKFQKLGGHVGLNTVPILKRVRREGWVILGGIVGDDGEFEPVGYNYGLESMPDCDSQFIWLSRQTLHMTTDMMSGYDPNRKMVNWRTGIASDIEADTLRKLGIEVPEAVQKISLRRLGIASALKYILCLHARSLNKDQLTFNIADLYDTQPGSTEMLQNGPSFFHNIRIFQEDLLHRAPSTDISVDRALGLRDKIAKIRWRARGDNPDAAIQKIEAPDSKLITAGWVLSKISQDWGVIDEQINYERGKEHVEESCKK